MRCRIATIAVVLAAAAIHAKTADQLKTDLAGILPEGKKARLAWQQGGTWTTSGNMALYGVDSDDGVIRRITASTSLSVDAPQITADGSRVIFADRNSGQIYIINWDGSGQRAVKSSGRCVGYWRNPADQSDWVIAGNDNAQSPFVRVNVDATSTSVVLWNGSTACASPEIGISQDGTRLSAYFEQSAGGWDPGTITVPNGPKVFTAKKGGCGMGMAPDNTYDYFVHWSRLGNGHHGIQFYSGSTAKDTFTLDDGILRWLTANNMENTCHNNDEFQNAKVTSDRNFVTFSMFNSKANPFLVRLSDRKWIHIDDQLGCTYTHGMDVLFLASSSTGRGLMVPRSGRETGASSAREVFSIHGRRLTGDHRAAVLRSGMFIQRAAGSSLLPRCLTVR